MVTVVQLLGVLEELEQAGHGDSEVRFVSELSFHPRHTALAEVAEPVGGKVLLLENLGYAQGYLETEEIEAVNEAFDNGFGL